MQTENEWRIFRIGLCFVLFAVQYHLTVPENTFPCVLCKTAKVLLNCTSCSKAERAAFSHKQLRLLLTSLTNSVMITNEFLTLGSLC